jgi:ribosomal protein L3 glutamine methyltransferase
MSADTHLLTTIDDLVRWGVSRFNEAELHFGHGTDNAADEALWLVSHALHLTFEQAATFGHCHVTTKEREAVVELLAERVRERRPAAYLTGKARFAGLEFDVDDRVLIPRSPIAEVIEGRFEPWVAGPRVRRVLDLCAGSGCIGLATAVYLPETVVDLADISPAALEVAERNRQRLGLEDRVHLLRSDLFASIDEADEDDGYDVILSNPTVFDPRPDQTLRPERTALHLLSHRGGVRPGLRRRALRPGLPREQRQRSAAVAVLPYSVLRHGLLLLRLQQDRDQGPHQGAALPGPRL